MDVLKESNEEIICYFQKFSDNLNFEKHLDQLKDLSQFRLKGDIVLGELKIPNIGPSENLLDFPNYLQGWTQKDVMEVRNIIKVFDSGEIESIEEAVLLIEIIKSKGNYPEIMDVIISDLKGGSLENVERYSDLLNFEKSEDSIIYGNIWKFLVSITC